MSIQSATQNVCPSVKKNRFVEIYMLIWNCVPSECQTQYFILFTFLSCCNKHSVIFTILTVFKCGIRQRSVCPYSPQQSPSVSRTLFIPGWNPLSTEHTHCFLSYQLSQQTHEDSCFRLVFLFFSFFAFYLLKWTGHTLLVSGVQHPDSTILHITKCSPQWV